MAFGQASGPPASAREVAKLGELLALAGYNSFREARHPLGLTQRQAAGKFTGDEARALIERLEGEAADDEVPPPEPPPRPVVRPAPLPRPARPPRPTTDPSDVTAAFPDELLADELVRRGWTCTPPP